ncbi:Uncharacterized protein TCM_037906 [Theobroma cacao]|uniref:Uncharacterized protein n=1 Tax=Theobroma cacao TaxID=3641 RepID=A0A061GNU6_THECC|nr:Uncharacterized protein TCM_037906 [Theobroma cacao]
MNNLASWCEMVTMMYKNSFICTKTWKEANDFVRPTVTIKTISLFQVSLFGLRAETKLWFSTAMDLRNWCNSGCKTGCLGLVYHEIEPVNSSSTTTGSNKLKWKVLWMKFKKEKRKICESPAQVPYDPYTYSQNFDQGFAWDDPDNLSRSFSMRFADPSSVFLRKVAV